MKSDCIIPCNRDLKQPRYLTSAAMVREDWIASGISESLVDANIAAIVEDAKRNLNAWIAEFVYSFKPGRLRTVLEKCRFRREEGFLETTAGTVKGLAVIIRPRSLREFRFLLSKIKPLRYKILKRDPQANFLIVATPDLGHMTTTDLATGQFIEVIGNGEVGA